VIEQYTVNLPSTIAFYGRHLKITIYSPQAFIEDFLNSFLVVVGLGQKYMYKVNYGSNVRRKGNFDTYKYRREARDAQGRRPLRPPLHRPYLL
jgi:hypothetical protein